MNLFRPLRSWSIRWRLTAWYTLSSLVVLVVAGTVAFYAFRATLIREMDRSLTIEGMSVISSAVGGELYHRGNSFISPKTDPENLIEDFSAQLPADATSPVGDPIYLRLLSENPDRVVLLSDNVKRHDFVQHTLYPTIVIPTNQNVTAYFAGTSEFDKLRVVDIRVPREPFVLQLATPWQRDEDALVPVINIIIAVVVFGFTLSGFGGWLLIGQTLRPITEIVTEAEQTTGDRLEPAFVAARTVTDDEIGHLASALNAMMARVHRAIASQRQFTADASHDLRTPLAILRGEIELALNRERTLGEYQGVLESALEETERLIRIITELGELASADVEKEHQLHRREIDLIQLCRSIAQSRQRQARQKDMSLIFDVFPTIDHVYTVADPLAVERAIGNLLDNAVNYSRPGGRITLRLRSSDRRVIIEIEDNGRGICEEDLPHVFDRFYRGDKSRSANAATERVHSGLGLAIVKSVVLAHDGEIFVNSKVNVGSVFTISLPCCSPVTEQ